MNKSNLLIGIHERPKSKLQWGVLSLQHVFAMFGATVLVPILTGLSISVALFASGIGTLIYIALTKAKVPVYLGSSFAYIAAISIASQSFGPEAAFVGLMVVGLIYVLVALGIRFAGKAWLDKILPPVVIGPMIAIIGISLAAVATGQAGLSPTSGDSYFAFLATDPMNAVIAVVAFSATVILAVFAKGFFKIVPIVGGIAIGYVFALVTGNVDFSGLEAFNLSDSLSIPFLYFAAIISVLSVAGIVTLLLSEKFSNKNSIIKIVIGVYLLSLFIGYALSAILTGGQIFAIPDFTFLGTYAIDFRAVAMFAPIAFVTIAEHIGDHKILGSITGEDFLKDPGLDRTLLGDGVATFVSAALGGPANTTLTSGVLA
jgi:uracil permease